MCCNIRDHAHALPCYQQRLLGALQVVSKGLPEQGGWRRVLVTPVAPIDSQLVESINSFGNDLFNAVGGVSECCKKPLLVK